MSRSKSTGCVARAVETNTNPTTARMINGNRLMSAKEVSTRKLLPARNVTCHSILGYGWSLSNQRVARRQRRNISFAPSVECGRLTCLKLRNIIAMGLPTTIGKTRDPGTELNDVMQRIAVGESSQHRQLKFAQSKLRNRARSRKSRMPISTQLLFGARNGQAPKEFRIGRR